MTADTFQPEADKPWRSTTKRLSRRYQLYTAVGRLDYRTVGISLQVDAQAPLYLCLELLRVRVVVCVVENELMGGYR